METISEFRLPELEIQSIKIHNSNRYFRIVTSKLDPIFIQLLKSGQIRVQIWLERELRKRSGSIVKRSWVHSIDNSPNAPSKLFTSTQYNYGDGLGWGWGVHNIKPPYSTTNGFAPTEFEILASDLIDDKIKLNIKISDIFTNILKIRAEHRFPVNGDQIANLEILGRHRMSSQPIRAKLVVNCRGHVFMSVPSNPMILGIHKDYRQPTFISNQFGIHMKVSYYK